MRNSKEVGGKDTLPQDEGKHDAVLKGQREREAYEKSLLLQQSSRVMRSPIDRSKPMDRFVVVTPNSLKKRKAEGSPRDSGVALRVRTELWSRLTKGIEDLQTLIRENPTTKADIKKCSANLRGLATGLNQLEDEVKVLHLQEAQAESGTMELTERRSVSTQTMPVSNMSGETDHISLEEEDKNRSIDLRSKIVRGIETAQIMQIVAGNWPKRAFLNTKMSGRSIVNGDTDTARLVLVESKSFNSSQLCRSLGLQVPGLRTGKVAEGEVLVAETRNSMFVEGTDPYRTGEAPSGC